MQYGLCAVDILLQFEPPLPISDCVGTHVSVNTREHPHKTSREHICVQQLDANTCNYKKYPVTLCTSHSFQPTSYLWKFPAMVLPVAFFALYI